MRNRLPFRRTRRPTDGEDRRSDEAASRDSRAHVIAVDCLRRRMAGEVISDVALLADHADLEPELSAALAHLQTVEQALFHSPPPASSATCEQDQPAASTTSSRDCRRNDLPVRCPHCHAPSDVPATGAWDDLTCSACGSQFSLVDLGASGSGQTVMTTVGHFELVEPLGAGGFGTVWKALDKELDRWVAIKIPRSDRLSPDQAEQFFREARAAAELRHPYIVSVHAVGRDEGKLYIVSDYVAGGSLAEWLADQRMTCREAATLCQKIALALEHAHQAGVVHRDLKPANILLSVDGEPYLTDFGLARRDLGETTVTLDGQLLGTPAYMSPEQARGEAHGADRRADIYSLGVILFELLTGELPFRGSTRMLLKQILEDEPPNPRSLNGGVPRDLATIALKCLEKDPGRRYASAQELADDLGRFLHREPISARPVSRAERAWRWCRRRPAVAGLTAAVATLLLTVASVTTYSSIRSQAAAKAARWQQYLSDMHTAMQLWDEGGSGRVVELLERHRPQAGDDDPRGFEWYYLWNQTRRGVAAPTLEHDSAVNTVAISPDGTLLASGDDAGQLLIWDLAARRLLTTRQADGSIDNLTFSPDGQTIATGGGTHEVRLWQVDGADEPLVLKGHRDQLLTLAFSPDGQRLATGALDGALIVWNRSTGELQHIWQGYQEKITYIVWRNSHQVLAASGEGAVREWDADSGQELRVLARLQLMPMGQGTSPLSPDQSTLAIGCRDGAIRLLDANDGTLRDTLVAHATRIRSLRFSPDGRTLATAGHDNQVQLWDLATRRVRGTLRGHSGPVTSVAFTPDGQWLATASQDKSVKLWNLDDPATVGDSVCLGHTSFVVGAVFDRTGQRLASASCDGTVRIWDVATGSQLHVLKGSGGWMDRVAFSPREAVVASTCDDGTLTLWNAATGQSLWSQRGASPLSRQVAFSPDGRVVTTGDSDGALSLWDAGTGDILGSFSLAQGGISDIAYSAYSPEGSQMAVAFSNGSLALVDPRTGVQLRRFAGHKSIVNAVVFSADGRLLASGSDDRQAKIWDVASGRELYTLRHGERVAGVGFSPDGKILASGGCDDRVRLWDVATGDERAVLHGHIHWVFAVPFSPDGTILASASNDATIHLWRAASAADVPVINEK